MPTALQTDFVGGQTRMNQSLVKSALDLKNGVDSQTSSVAVIGCGYWGQNHVRVFQTLGALRAVCDPDSRGQARALELAPDVRIEADPDRIFDDPQITGVVIATPAETHAAVCQRA